MSGIEFTSDRVPDRQGPGRQVRWTSRVAARRWVDADGVEGVAIPVVITTIRKEEP